MDVVMRGAVRDLGANLEEDKVHLEPLQPSSPQITRPKSGAPYRHRQCRPFHKPSISTSASDDSTTACGSKLTSNSHSSSGSSLDLSAVNAAAASSSLPVVQNEDALRAREIREVRECLSKSTWGAPQPPANLSARRTVSARPATCRRRHESSLSPPALAPGVSDSRGRIRFELEVWKERRLFDQYLGSIRSHNAGVSFGDDTSFMEPGHPLRSSLG